MRRVSIGVALLVGLSSLSFSFGAEEGISVTGTVYVAGSEPHGFLALVDGDITYRLTGALVPELEQNYQNHTVSVRGVIVEPAAGPRPAKLEVRSYRVVR